MAIILNTTDIALPFTSTDDADTGDPKGGLLYDIGLCLNYGTEIYEARTEETCFITLVVIIILVVLCCACGCFICWQHCRDCRKDSEWQKKRQQRNKKREAMRANAQNKKREHQIQHSKNLQLQQEQQQQEECPDVVVPDPIYTVELGPGAHTKVDPYIVPVNPLHNARTLEDSEESSSEVPECMPEV
eukprot:CAMPEP_0197034172 /NCGR_PEP_ID=MMETSP1384-20130603/12357_1 /TAXON_ID=29189 /ORGANISM="Ammonia sp." /LENGTH=187 /DNA_ID=CAMNT_0042464063 /DNA_START=95 /DNA_END=658 /DNA_ORIENTATION=+